MIVYGPMKESEEKDVYSLIVRIFQEHVAAVYSKKGIEKFLCILSPNGLCEMNKRKSSFVVLAKHPNRPIGMLAVRNESNIALIFVHLKYQGKGIGKRLLGEAIKICLNRNSELTVVTMSSSPNSILSMKESALRLKGMK